MEKLYVVKVGGAVVEDSVALSAMLDSFISLPGKKILVHGGGREATRMAESLGIETKMVQGRRVTDEKMLKVVTMVYGGLINKDIVAKLQARGANALGLSGADLGCIQARKRPVSEVDYGYVGDVNKVETNILSELLQKDVVPVLAPLSYDGKGSLLNTNADTIASCAAAAFAFMYNVELIYCFEKKGVLLNPDDDSSVIENITEQDFRSLCEKGIVSGGMIPKLQNAYDSIHKGVGMVRITSSDAMGAGTCILG